MHEIIRKELYLAPLFSHHPDQSLFGIVLYKYMRLAIIVKPECPCTELYPQCPCTSPCLGYSKSLDSSKCDPFMISDTERHLAAVPLVLSTKKKKKKKSYCSYTKALISCLWISYHSCQTTCLQIQVSISLSSYLSFSHSSPRYYPFVSSASQPSKPQYVPSVHPLITQITITVFISTRQKKNAYQAFLLFVFSFSFLLTAFFNLVSSSRIFVPSRRASALSHFSFSSMDLRFSSDMVASFSLRAASCSRACEGSDVVLSRSAFFDEDLLMILPNVMFVSFA